jgi:hypothetical protein
VRRLLPLLLAAAVACPAGASGFVLGSPATAFSEAPRHFGLSEETSASRQEPAAVPVPPAGPTGAPPPPKLFDRKTTLFTAGVLVLVPAIGYLAWWHNDTYSFHRVNEGWFGEDAYAGGADKASHITFAYMVTLGFQSAYRALGKTPAQSRALAFGLTTVAGVIEEVGDGFSKYGFSWQDITANTIGAGLATAVDAFGLRDTVVLRFGNVPNTIPPPCCRYPGFGADYSDQIYTADLLMSGFLPRVGAKPGIARFFLTGMTYGSKGYRHSPPESRQRQLGIEIGLNVPEILRAVGVRDTTWWGKALLVFFKYYRIPYTAFGWQVDLNTGKWYGPNIGGSYDPGYVIYD